MSETWRQYGVLGRHLKFITW